MELLKVLIVDDHHDLADSLAQLVQLEGYTPLVAYDTSVGLRVADEEVPDVIIHDIGMPGMSGYEAARHLRQKPRLRKTVLVAHTAYSTNEDQRRALEAGFDRHITKPMDPAVLTKLLKSILQQQRLNSRFQ